MIPPRLEIDCIAPPRRRWRAGTVLLVAALAVAAHGAVRYRDIARERAPLATKLELLDAGPRDARPGSAARLTEEAKNVRTVLRQLTLPWPQMIESVESTGSEQVALLQLQPEPERRLLRLTAEAGTQEAMLQYVRRLGESKMLGEVHLVSHEIQRESPSHAVQFVAQASLKEAR